MHQLDKGEFEGLALWEEAFINDQTIEPPGGYPELRFYDVREARTQRTMRIMPRRRHGLFSDPLEDRGWQVIESAAAEPSGWAPTAEFIGHLPACLRYAARTYALDLDCESVTCQGLDRPMLKALAGALR